MAIITLTTDLGTKDYYLSSIKGAILSQCADVTIVDITHDIPKYDILEASFVLKNSYSSFPKGTIHVIGVNTSVNDETRHLAVSINGHYFIAADNGLFAIMFDKEPDKIVELNIAAEGNSRTFPTRDIFVVAACHIARGGTLEVIGKPQKSFLQRTLLRAVVDDSVIRGSVIYIDSYENVFTNITERLFKETARGRPFRIFMKHLDYEIQEISKSYDDVPEGEMISFFSLTGFLEIAINKGHASSLLGLKLRDTIRIEFG